jgi:hypothetical protein
MKRMGLSARTLHDGSNVSSVRISQSIIQKIGFPINREVLVGQNNMAKI